MKSLLRNSVLAVAFLICSAHVGSPDAWFEGAAGPYRVLVHIEAPGVIPGIAGVNVHVKGDGVQQVTATANRYDATGGAPPPEIAKRVDAESGVYRTRLWIMTSGSYSITIGVNGTRGSGSAVVPLGAVPIRRLGFAPRLGFVLGAVGTILLVGLLTIVGASVREGVLPPGVTPDERRRRLARRAILGAGLVVALILFGGWRWWQYEDALFARSMFRPLTSTATVVGSDIVLTISDSSWIMRNNAAWLRTRGATSRAPLIEDHGKIMHLFVLDAVGGRAFAHLHPATTDSIHFTAALPPLPPGRYSVFGDIVHESGFAQTLVADIEIVGAPAASVQGDDSYTMRAPEPNSSTAILDDGSVMTWLSDTKPIVAGEDARLRFAISSSVGGPPLELYMGMAAHAAVARDDAQIFNHLHPGGTTSMAAQMQFVGDSAVAHDMMHAPSDTVSFPYAFPEPGRYRVWVQMKRGGRVLTGVYEILVGG